MKARSFMEASRVAGLRGARGRCVSSPFSRFADGIQDVLGGRLCSDRGNVERGGVLATEDETELFPVTAPDNDLILLRLLQEGGEVLSGLGVGVDLHNLYQQSNVQLLGDLSHLPVKGEKRAPER